MGAARRIILGLFVVGSLLVSCSSTPEELVARHERRGDDYMRQEKFKEAVIEYKNVVKAAPAQAIFRWKLAQAALEANDLRIAFEELQKTVELDPGNLDAAAKLGEVFLLAGRRDDAGQIADNLVNVRPKDPKGYLLRSGVHFRAGDLDGAIAQLKTAVDLGPGDARPMLALGNLHLIKRDLATARQWFDRALATNPNMLDVHVTRGNFFFATGDAGEGEKEYRKAIGMGKDKEGLRIALAERYLNMGRNDDSSRELEALIKETNSQKARKVLAEVRIETGKIADAKAIVDAILKENDKDVDGKYLKGRIALAEKRLDEARLLFTDVVKQDVGMARARLYNGLTGIFQGHIEEGRKEVQEAVRLDPGNVKARLVLGDILLKANAPAAAETEAVDVLRREPANAFAAAIYGDSFLLRREWRKAEQVYGSMIGQLPRGAVGYYKMGISRKLQGKPGEAAGFFAQAVDRNPKDLTSIHEYVFALANSGKGDKAEKVVDRYLAENPKEALLWELAGRFHTATRRPDRAEAAFLKAIDLAPDLTRPYFELGVLYASQRKLPAAEARLQTVVERNRRDVGARALLGVVLNLQGRFDEANRRYREVLELGTTNALAANNLASNLCDHGGNLDEALKFAQIAREAAPEDPNVGDTLGWVYFRKGLIDMAYPLIAESAMKLGRNASVRYHHGMALAAKGRPKEARAELSAALALGSAFPEKDDAKRKLESLR